MHKTQQAFATSFKYRNQMPTNALFYYTKFFGSKDRKAKVSEVKQAVDNTVELCEKFKYYALNEWVFDSTSVGRLNAFLATSNNAAVISEFVIDINKLNW